MNKNIDFKNINYSKSIFRIPFIKMRISLFLYDYNYSVLNNRIDLFKNTDYLDINLLNTKLLILAEKMGNIELIKYLYKQFFIGNNILLQEEWLDLYTNKKKRNIIDCWEIYNLYSVINNQVIDRPGENNETWIDVGLRYIGMGLFCVMSLLKNDKKCFFRISGGSTGYDYIGYRNSFINFNPYSNPDKLFDIEEGIHIMNTTPEKLFNITQKGNIN